MDTQNKARTTEELKQKLEQQVEAARKRLDELKRDIGSLHEQDRQALQEKREEIHRRVEAQKERGRQLRTGFEQWGREKVGHTKEAVASWRQQSEIHKLRSRADRAEEYAVGAIVAAALDADEAEEAVLDAISARMDAEAASPQ